MLDNLIEEVPPIYQGDSSLYLSRAPDNSIELIGFGPQHDMDAMIEKLYVRENNFSLERIALIRNINKTLFHDLRARKSYLHSVIDVYQAMTETAQIEEEIRKVLTT